MATFQQPVVHSGQPFPARKTTYIFAGGWKGSPFPQFHERAKASGWHTHTLDGGHDLMLDKPAEVLQMLLASAARQI